MNATTGVVTFEVVPDFETLDTYSFTAKSMDAVGNEATQDMTIHIGDVAEGQAPKKQDKPKAMTKMVQR